MKESQSLEISAKIKYQLKRDLLGPMIGVFPEEAIEKYKQEKGRRNRIYTLENTLISMVMSATGEDKTLQRSVMTFKEIYEKTHGKEISLNTASYTEARQRLPQALLDDVFKASKCPKSSKKTQWYGKQTYIADGTYLQMQDSKELGEKYACKTGKKSSEAMYPQGLLQCMISQDSGCIDQYDLASRSYSELDLVFKQLKNLPKNSLVLADALYECRAVFQAVQSLKLDVIVPLKRRQSATRIRLIADGDEVIEVKMTEKSKKRLQDNDFLNIPEIITLRRITYSDPQNAAKKHVLLTTLLDESIPAKDIIMKYQSRWDIEISIREIKTIMHLHVLRSKSEDMIFKELATAMIAYNLIRKIISESTLDSDFSPKTDIFYSFYSIDKDLLIDKKGRLYQRWSPGRYPSSKKTH